MNQDLANYIESEKARGVSRDEIRVNLVGNGWAREEVEQALNELMPIVSVSTPAPSTTQSGGVVPAHFPQQQSAVAVPSSGALVQLPGVFALLREAWRIYRQKWPIYSGLIFIPSFLVIGAQEALAPLFGIQKPFSADVTFAIIDTKTIWFVTGIATVPQVARLLAQITILVLFKNRSSVDGGVGKSIRMACGVFFPAVWASMLLGAFSLAFFVVPMIVVFLGASFSSGFVHDTPLLSWLILGLGGVVGVVGMVFYARFLMSMVLAPFVIVAEEKRGWDALLASRWYTKGRLGSIFSGSLVLLLFYFLILIIGQIISGMFGAAGGFASAVALSLTYALWFPLFLVHFGLLYEYVRDAKNGEVPVYKQRKLFSIGSAIGLVLIGAIAIGSVLAFTVFRSQTDALLSRILKTTEVETIIPKQSALDMLDSQPHINQEHGYQVRLPKGWSTVLVRDGEGMSADFPASERDRVTRVVVFPLLLLGEGGEPIRVTGTSDYIIQTAINSNLVDATNNTVRVLEEKRILLPNNKKAYFSSKIVNTTTSYRTLVVTFSFNNEGWEVFLVNPPESRSEEFRDLIFAVASTFEPIPNWVPPVGSDLRPTFRKFISGSGDFSVDFPGDPKRQSETIQDPSAQQTLKADLYTAFSARQRIEWSVASFMYPSATEMTPKKGLEIVEAVLGAKVASSSPTTVSGVSAIEFFASDVLGTSLDAKGAVLTKGNKLYILSQTCDLPLFIEEDYRHFINSFALISDSIDSSKTEPPAVACVQAGLPTYGKAKCCSGLIEQGGVCNVVR